MTTCLAPPSAARPRHASSRDLPEPSDSVHIVGFHDSDLDLIPSVTDYLREALQAGDAALVVATATHRELIGWDLAAAHIDVDTAMADGRLTMLDARDTLNRFTINDSPDAAAFDAVVGAVIRGLAHPGHRLRVFGEMVGLLWARNLIAEAVHLETLWNRLGESVRFDLYCGYRTAPINTPGVANAEVDEARLQICRLHTHVLTPPTQPGVPTIDTHPAPPARPHDSAATVPRTEQSASFSCQPASGPAARRFVTTALQHCVPAACLDDAVLVIAELAANAIIHAGTDFTVTLSWPPNALRLAVLDTDPTPPTPRNATPDQSSGRGMGIVTALADRWGVDPSADGKVVWADIALPPAGNNRAPGNAA